MVIHVCEKCHKKFTRKDNYVRHLSRKNPCQKVEFDNHNNFGAPNCTKKSANCTKKSAKCAPQKKKNNSRLNCNFCNKIFSRRFTLNRHLEICKIKLNKIKEEENKKIQKLIEINEKLLSSQKELIKNQKDNEQKLDTLQKNVNKLKQNNVINNKIINNNITLIAYNKPDLSHLTNNDYIKIMNRGFNSVPYLIKAIHFNPMKPENKNIYIPNIKNKYVMLWNGTDWKLNNSDDILDDLYENNSNILIEKMEEFIDIGDELEPRIINKFRRFVDKKEEDSIKNKIKEEIKLLLYNNRKLCKDNFVVHIKK